MKDECCHQHPDNGSDLALQTESQTEETDLRAVNAALLEALEVAVEWRDKLAANPTSQEAWEALVEENGCLDNEARAAIKEANK